MHLISFKQAGSSGFGAIVAGGVVDLTGKGPMAPRSVLQALEMNLLDDLRAQVKGSAPDLTLAALTLLPVVPDPRKILCIGLNYVDHVAETKREIAQYPTVFTRFADSQTAHGTPLLRPVGCIRFDFEGELAVIIGRSGRHIPRSEALSYIAGYSCYNDASARDWQKHTSQFTPGKNFPGTGGFGPALVTADEIQDYRDLELVTRINGEIMQHASLHQLIFSIEDLIAYCSNFTQLSPGDVIVTGTPGGVGDRRDPPRYLAPGDRVEVEIGPIGCLTNTVADAPA